MQSIPSKLTVRETEVARASSDADLKQQLSAAEAARLVEKLWKNEEHTGGDLGGGRGDHTEEGVGKDRPE